MASTSRKHRHLENPKHLLNFSIPVWHHRRLDILVSTGTGSPKVRFMFTWYKYFIIGNDRFWGTNKWWFWDIG